MKYFTLLLLFVAPFWSSAQQCTHSIPTPVSSSGGGIYHVFSDSTIDDQDGSVYYVCEGVHLTVQYSAGCTYFLESNALLTINDHAGDAVFAKGNCIIVDNTTEGIVVTKEASSSFSKPLLPSAAVIFTCATMLYDYSLIGGVSPCGGVNGIHDINTPSLMMYPNPVSSHEMLNFNQEVRNVAIFNFNGQLVSQENNLNQKSLALSNLFPGLFIIEAELSNGQLVRNKIVIQ